MPPLFPSATLQDIRTKVRQLTRSPSEAMLTTTDLDYQINTFIVYDFPQHLQTFPLHTTFFFFTQPNIDTYEPSNDPSNPLYMYDQLYTSFSGPIYIAGLEGRLSQSRSEFYRIFPFVNSIQSTQLVGDGVTTNFTGILSQVPVLRNQVTFTAKDANNNGMVLYDDGNGNLLLQGGVVGQTYGTIDYILGNFTLNFIIPPASGALIYAETYPYVAARPVMALFYDNKFVIRPVPDKSYKIIMNARIRPTAFLTENPTAAPQIFQWWQYIAYGAAKKIFENRMDLNSVELIMPEFKKQEALVERNTILQLTNQRSSTIYTNQSQQSAGFNPYGNLF